MIKLNNLLFLLLFNITFITASNKSNPDPNITIEILNIVTNGLVLPNNTFNFNGIDDLIIEFDVRTSYTGTVAKYNEGTSAISFYEPNSFNNETAEHYDNGVRELNLIWKPIKLEHISNNNYSYTYREKLLFKKSTVYNTGCSIVFYYGPTKLTYRITGGTKTENEPYKAATANVTLTNISYTDGLPIINNTIIVPDYDGDELGTKTINLSFNYNYNYGSNLKQIYPNYNIQVKSDTYHRIFFPLNITLMEYNNTITVNNLEIKSSDILNNTYLRFWLSFQEASLDLNFINIKGNYDKKIVNNIISDSQTIPYGQVCKPFSLSSSPYIDFTIPCNYRNCSTTRDYRYITSFQWQARTQSTNWTNIPGATAKEYSPNKTFTENTYYRRLAFYNTEQYNISNITSIIIENNSITNNICCGQSLQFKNSQPQPIIGDYLNTDTYTYQWQSSKNTRGTDYLPWHDITGATNQNYTHIFTEDAATNDEKTRFRRIVKHNSLPINISNSIIISRYTDVTAPAPPRDNTRPPRSQSLNSANTFITAPNEDLINETIIYPNPFINNFSIEGPINIDQISLYDSFGKAINIIKTQKSENLIEVNAPNLQSGIHILKIDNTTFSKTLLKN